MLDQEIKYYEAQREKLLATDRDKFVLIKGEKVIGIYDSEAAAYTEGLNEIGNEPFLIKQITDQDGDTVTLPAFVLGLIDAHI